MKVRTGFVSNSSSASFVLDKRYLTPNEIDRILAYNDNPSHEKWRDSWRIEEDEDFVRGDTIMDNGYLFEFIKTEIDPPTKAIVSWEGE